MNPDRRTTFITATTFFVLTFGLCATLIVTTPQRPLPDPTLYEGIAANLAAGNGYSFDLKPPYRPEITRTPFLPYSISVLYRVIGRAPGAVLWLNALYISLAIALGYVLIWRLFADRRIAATGAAFAMLVPQLSGAANNILTEPPAMLLIAGILLLILDWPSRLETRNAPLFAALLGLLCAALTLNRTAMTISILVAAAYICFVALKGRWKSGAAWISVVVFCATLGAPVLAWSARNHALGLPFSPAPVGLYASRVFDMKRFKDILWDEGTRLPACNHLYMKHWKRRWSPEVLFTLEAQNRAWFERWWEAHSDRAWKAMPARFVNLFSAYRNSIYPSWSRQLHPLMSEVSRWVSRGIWLLALSGFLLAWRNRRARWIWLVCMIPLVITHMLTVAHTRYVFPLIPVLVPFAGVTFVKLWDAARARLKSRRNGALPTEATV